MDDVAEGINQAPRMANNFLLELELTKQLSNRHKQVKLQNGEDCVYHMMLDTPMNRTDLTNQLSGQTESADVSNRIYVQRSLGHGGFGIVYKAEMIREDNTKLCLKMALHKSKYSNERERAKGQKEVNKSLLREAKHYKKLSSQQHSNVISMHFSCVSRDHNEVFLALEYCKGMDLSHLVKHYRDKKLPSKLLRKIMLESTRAVEHCLSHNIVHCDVKPSNILFTSMDLPLKLFDFGCAVDMDEGIEDGRGVAGTYIYMAPELILHGLPAIHPKSDVYSLGSLFFNVVTRKTPWSHHERVKAAWRDRDKRDDIRNVIKEEHKQYFQYYESLEACNKASEQLKPTILQSILSDSTRPHFPKPLEECKLIGSMLSFLYDDRPSCEEIIDAIQTLHKRSLPSEGSSEPADSFYIPAPVASWDTASSRVMAQTTLSSAAKKFLVDCQLSTRGIASGMEHNSYSFGPPSNYSYIAEDIREDYNIVLADEVRAREERLKLLQEEIEVDKARCERERADLKLGMDELRRMLAEFSRHKAEFEKEKAETRALLPSAHAVWYSQLATLLNQMQMTSFTQTIPDDAIKQCLLMLNPQLSNSTAEQAGGAGMLVPYTTPDATTIANYLHTTFPDTPPPPVLRQRNALPIVNPDTKVVINDTLSLGIAANSTTVKALQLYNPMNIGNTSLPGVSLHHRSPTSSQQKILSIVNPDTFAAVHVSPNPESQFFPTTNIQQLASPPDSPRRNAIPIVDPDTRAVVNRVVSIGRHLSLPSFADNAREINLLQVKNPDTQVIVDNPSIDKSAPNHPSDTLTPRKSNALQIVDPNTYSVIDVTSHQRSEMDNLSPRRCASCHKEHRKSNAIPIVDPKTKIVTETPCRASCTSSGNFVTTPSPRKKVVVPIIDPDTGAVVDITPNRNVHNSPCNDSCLPECHRSNAIAIMDPETRTVVNESSLSPPSAATDSQNRVRRGLYQ